MDRPLDDLQEEESIPYEKWFGMLALALAIEPIVYAIMYLTIRNIYGTDYTYYTSTSYRLLHIAVSTMFRLVPILMALKLRSEAIRVVVIVIVSSFWLLDVLRTFDIFNIYE